MQREIAPPDALAAARAALEAYRALGDRYHEYWALNFYIPLAERAGERIDVEAAIAQMRALEGAEWPPLVLRLRRGTEAGQLGRRGDWAAYRDAFRDEAQRMAALGEWRGAWFASQSHGLAEPILGNPAAAVAALRPVVEQIRAHGGLRQTWTPLGVYTAGLIESGDLDGAATALRELLPLIQAEGSAAWGIDHASLYLLQRGDHEGAALVVHGWSDASAKRRGERRGPGIRETFERVGAALRAHHGADALAALMARGAAMDEDTIVARVLDGCAG